MENDYGGDHTRLVDVVRGSGIFITLLSLAYVIENLLEEGALLCVVRAKDRLNGGGNVCRSI